ncbi:unnamed protein product [Miscanthus lutarioriparius]|uniref:Ubiquitin-like protease family profile domain-containing protein n=1 Tax=Miscanthus lutarioriparius TaxID=422564 RepID=A0A811Q9X3_9POAL|nr:unnamed protein product [Miscanthus lutarioriparius]
MVGRLLLPNLLPAFPSLPFGVLGHMQGAGLLSCDDADGLGHPCCVGRWAWRVVHASLSAGAPMSWRPHCHGKWRKKPPWGVARPSQWRGQERFGWLGRQQLCFWSCHSGQQDMRFAGARGELEPFFFPASLLLPLPLHECQSKCSRTSRTTTLKTSGRSKNVLPSFYANLPQRRVSCHGTSRRNEANQDKLNTDIFELYMEYVVLVVSTSPVSWSSEEICILIAAMTSCTGIFGSTLIKIRRVLMGTWIPYGLTCITMGVPQKNGDECGIYVLYFIHCFLQNKELAEVLENKRLEEDFTQLLDDGWFNPEELENFCKDIHSFQENRNNKIAE